MILYQIFVYLRLVVTFYALFGLTLLSGYHPPQWLVNLLMFAVFLVWVCVTIPLAKKRRSAWRLNWWVMGAEIIGIESWALSENLAENRLAYPHFPLLLVGGFILIWFLPNAIYFYLKRFEFR
jgi:hypothetical protein